MAVLLAAMLVEKADVARRKRLRQDDPGVPNLAGSQAHESGVPMLPPKQPYRFSEHSSLQN